VKSINEEAASEVEAAFLQAQADPPAEPDKLMAAAGMGE
jgi:hypothetical protein